MKSSVTSDYNEPEVSVTRVLSLIFHLAFLCAVATSAAGSAAHLSEFRSTE